jgi:hypothetical protein
LFGTNAGAAVTASTTAAAAAATGLASSAKAGEVTMKLVAPMTKAIALPAKSRFIQINILSLSLKR